MVIYKTKIDITVDPVWHQDPPEIRVKIGLGYSWSGKIQELTTFSHEWDSGQGAEQVSVQLVNKKDSDTVGDRDKAVVIKSIRFNNIGTDKMLWQGRYHPCYPEPWATQQKNAGQELPESLVAHTYLGWNGIWMLDFEIPVFTWIHQIEDLGWIYD